MTKLITLAVLIAVSTATIQAQTTTSITGTTAPTGNSGPTPAPVTTSAEKPYMFVEQPPSFPGGEKALAKFLQKNMRYPNEERRNKIEGRVLVEFVVDEKGAIQDVTVKKSVCPALDKEALRIIKMLPNFVPGMHDGKCVKCYYDLPLMFKIT